LGGNVNKILTKIADICNFRYFAGNVKDTRIDRFVAENITCYEVLNLLAERTSSVWFVRNNELFFVSDLRNTEKNVSQHHKVGSSFLRKHEIETENGTVFNGFDLTMGMSPEIAVGDKISFDDDRIMKVIELFHSAGSDETSVFLLPDIFSGEETREMRDHFSEKSESRASIVAGDIRRSYISSERFVECSVDLGEREHYESPSIASFIDDSIISNNKISVENIPVMCGFATENAGVFYPILEDMRAVVARVGDDPHDLVILGFVPAKSGTSRLHTLPSGYEAGDFQLTVPINDGERRTGGNSDILLNRDGNWGFKGGSINIKMGTAGLTQDKPDIESAGNITINTSAGNIVIDTDTGNITVQAATNVVLEGTNIKLGSTATLGVARNTDSVIDFATFNTWLNAHTHLDPISGQTGPASTGVTGPWAPSSQIGTISHVRTKVLTE
jgi:hypothetical protein